MLCRSVRLIGKISHDVTDSQTPKSSDAIFFRLALQFPLCILLLLLLRLLSCVTFLSLPESYFCCGLSHGLKICCVEFSWNNRDHMHMAVWRVFLMGCCYP